MLRPALSDREGGALFIGTPKGFNHFHKLYVEDSLKPGWAGFQFTTLQGGQVSQAELNAAAEDMDAKTFRQEYEACFENFEGRAYYAFSRDANVMRLEYDPSAPISWALDFNYHPMCSVIGQLIDPTGGDDRAYRKKLMKFHFLDELYIAHSNTPEACEVFHVKLQTLVRGRKVHVNVYGDASGAQHQTGPGSPSDWKMVRDFFARHAQEYTVSFKIHASNPAVKDRIAAVNAAFCSASGDRRAFVDPRCKNLMKDLEAVTFKPGTAMLDSGKEKLLTHISDAAGYWIESEAGLRTDGGPRRAYVG